MKNIFFLLAIQLLICSNIVAQKKGAAPTATTEKDCKCSDLEIFPYFYYQEPESPNYSHLLLRFDYKHKGMKCLPVFLNSITIYRSPEQTVTIPLNRLTSDGNTVQGHVFIIPQILIPASMLPMTIGGNYKITYSLQYGIKSVCPAQSTKTVRFKKEEPLL